VAIQPSHAEPRGGGSRVVAAGLGGGGLRHSDGKTKSADFGVIVDINKDS